MSDTTLLVAGVLLKRVSGTALNEPMAGPSLRSWLSKWKEIPKSPNPVTGRYSCSNCILIAEMHKILLLIEFSKLKVPHHPPLAVLFVLLIENVSADE